MADPIIIDNPIVTTGDNQNKDLPFTGSFPIEYTRPQIQPLPTNQGWWDKTTDEWMSSTSVQTAIGLYNARRNYNIGTASWDGISISSGESPYNETVSFDRYNPNNFVGYERIADKLVQAESQTELEGLKLQYDEQNARKERIQQDPSFTAALSAAAADPLNLLIPFWTVRGAGVISNIFRGAVAGGGASLVDSALGYQFDPTFTIDDVKERVFYGTLFGSILGGGIGFATRNAHGIANNFASGNKELDNLFDEVRTQAGPDGYIPTRPSVYKAEPTTFNPGVAKTFLGLQESVRMSPFGRVMQSGIRSIADLAYMTVGDGGVKLARNVDGIASPDSIYTRISNRKSIVSSILQETDNLYNEYRTGATGLNIAGQNVYTAASRVSDVFTTPAKRAARNILTPSEFDREVFRAFKADKIEATSRVAEANPFIQRAAESLQKKFEATRVELNQNGLFLDRPTRTLELKRIVKRKEDLQQKLVDVINAGDVTHNSTVQIKRIENEIARMHDQIAQYEMYGMQHIDDMQGAIDGISATYKENKRSAASAIDAMRNSVTKFNAKYKEIYDDLSDMIENGEVLTPKQQAFYDSLSEQMGGFFDRDARIASLVKKFNRPLTDKEMNLFETLTAAIDHTKRLAKLVETGAYEPPAQHQGGVYMHRIFNKEAIAMDDAAGGPRRYRKILTDAFTEQTAELGYLHEKKAIADDLLKEKYSNVQNILDKIAEKFAISNDELSEVERTHEGMFGKSIKTLLKEANVSVKYGATGKTRADGSPVHAIYHGKTNSISIDLEAVAKQWINKPWENPKVAGVDPLDSNVFKTPADWAEFVFRHEIAHSTLKRGAQETLAEYENRINRVAMNQMEQRVPKRKLTDAERQKANVAKEIRRSINDEIENVNLSGEAGAKLKASRSPEDDLMTPEQFLEKKNAIKARALIKDIKDGLVERLDKTDFDGRVSSKINQRVDEMINKQLGLNDIDVNDSSGFGPSSWRLGRKINLTNEELDGFLVDDVREVSRRYFEQSAKAIEYKKAFGTVDGEEAVADAFIQAASEVKGNSVKKIEDTLYKHEVDLRLAMDSANHSLKNDMPLTWTNQIVRLLKNYAASTMMGKVIKSQVVDVLRPVMVFGFGRTYEFVINNIVGGMSNIKKSSAELQAVLSEGHDTVMGTVLRKYMDSNGNYKAGSVGVQKFKEATEGFNKFAEGPMYVLNGLSIVTDYSKLFTNLMSSNYMIEDAINVSLKKATTQQLERLLSYGLSLEDINNIAALHKNGIIERTPSRLHLANIAEWPDRNLANKFASAITQETNRVIVTPSAADKSALAQGVFQATSPMGRKIFGDERLDIALVQFPLQFMTWGMGANNRILLSSLQGRDANTVGGALVLIGGGYLSTYLKTPDNAWNKMKFEDKLVNAIDTSGLLGSIVDINNMVETASYNTLGFRPMAGMDPHRRGMDDSMTDILGPAPNMLMEIPKLMTDPYMTDHQKGNIYRRMIPLNNVIWWDGLLKNGQKSIGY